MNKKMITGFQFKSAKEVLNLQALDISQNISIHPGSISRLLKTGNLDILNCNTRNMFAIIKFFESRNIIFSGTNTISLNNSSCPVEHDNLTRFQFKIARITAGLTQEELSKSLKVSSSTISNLEQLPNTHYLLPNKINIPLLKKYFEYLGIIFADNLTVSIIKDPIKVLSLNKNIH